MDISLSDIYTLLTSIVTIASVIVGFTDTPKDDGVVKKVYRAVEIFGMVTEKAKQK